MVLDDLSLEAQLAEVERELALRAKVYGRMVATRQMRESEADYHMRALQAVAQTLRGLLDDQLKRG